MKVVILILSLSAILVLSKMMSQHLDASFPFTNVGSGNFELGAGFYQPLKRINGIMQLKGNYLQLGKSVEFLNATIGSGYRWFLNTPTPSNITATTQLGYFKGINEQMAEGGFMFGLEVDYQNDFFNRFTFPISFQRFSSENFKMNLFKVGLRYHIIERNMK